MKILFFSDSHGDLNNLDYVIENIKPERIFGLGDFEVNEYELSSRSIMGVRGNSPFDPEYKLDHTFELFGNKILLTHGHRHNVRSGLLSLKYFAKEKECNIVFYGHTHVANIDYEDGVYFINPGSIRIPYVPSYPTVAIMNIDIGMCAVEIVDALTFETYKKIEIKK